MVADGDPESRHLWSQSSPAIDGGRFASVNGVSNFARVDAIFGSSFSQRTVAIGVWGRWCRGTLAGTRKDMLGTPTGELNANLLRMRPTTRRNCRKVLLGQGERFVSPADRIGPRVPFFFQPVGQDQPRCMIAGILQDVD